MLDICYDPPERERNPGKPWKWMLIDSAVIAGIAFVASLPGDRLPSVLDLYIALKAFIYSFLMQLAVERGIKPRVRRR